jgi:ATP-dependent Zn protease
MQAWWSFIVSWIPLLLVLGFWVFFMKYSRASRYGALIDRSFQHMDRVEVLLERIAAAVEQQPPRS